MAHTRFSPRIPQSPSTSVLPRLLASSSPPPPHPYSHGDLVLHLPLSPCFSLSLLLARSSSRITCGSFSARGTRPPRSSRRGTGPTPRLFQTHFNSLPGSASAEWRADKCAVREHRHDEALRARARESRNINMKIRARGAIIPRIRS